MGGGGRPPEGVPVIPSPRRQRRVRTATRSEEESGIDSPPAILSRRSYTVDDGRVWEPRRMQIRTSQLLCSLQHPLPLQKEFSQLADLVVPAGTAPCDPLVAFGRYVVSATDDGQVCFYQVVVPTFSGNGTWRPSNQVGEGDTSEEKTSAPGPLSPLSVCLCRRDAKIVCLATGPDGVFVVDCHNSSESGNKMMSTVSPPGFLGHIVALTAEGEVFLLTCSIDSSGLTVQTTHSWNLDQCNPHYASFRYNNVHQEWRLCIGYDSGCIEEWHVSLESAAASPTTAGTNRKVAKPSADVPQGRQEGRQEDTTATICWRGCFEAKFCSVLTICEPNTPKRREPELTQRTEIRADEDSPSAGKIGEPDICTNVTEHETDLVNLNDFLAVVTQVSNGMIDDRLSSQTPSPTIEMVNLSAVERDWKQMLSKGAPSESDLIIMPANNGSVALALAEYCVWPQIGMELLDSSSMLLPGSANRDRHYRFSRQIQMKPSRGSDKMCACNGTDPSFAAALSDGTIAIMSSSSLQGRMSWGISCSSNQLHSTYPVIGISTVERDGTRHVACCLRGGTVYVIPITGRDTDLSDCPISVFLPVEEESEESVDRYIQGFSAGNVAANVLSDSSKASLNVPIMVFSGAAGVLEVHACMLMEGGVEERLLQDMLDNGSVQLLCELLSSLTDECDALLQQNSYADARDELLRANVEHEKISVQDLNSEQFSALRGLLLDVATDS